MSVPFLHIEPTNLCNLNCVMCTRQNLRRFGSMSLDDLKHIVGQVPRLKAVKLQGMGEPMLNPEIIPMMRYLRSRSIRVYTAINGTVLPPDIDELMDVVNRIEFSIDSVDPDEYRSIRGTGNIEEVVDNLKLICRAREKHPQVLISINCVILDDSEKRLADLFDLAGETGVDGINFNIAQNWTVDGNHRKEYRAEYDLNIVEAVVDEMSRRNSVNATVRKPVYGYSACEWARIGCYITWDGFVTPCCQRPDPDEINFGNIFTMSFDRIYHSPRYVDFREKLLGDEAPYECSNCAVYINRQVANGCAVPCKS